ncbi:VOC family protein [Stutzerimonas azotifigens]|uniref:VOC family protein n=1 Tax=Stutzerimonas azotifigens TaxID=291995 RepID=UPI0003F94F8B|nr:VOC family protein [Stutzerimonas azotifigens]
MKFSTYLTFDGNTREAFTFYQQVLGGQLEIMSFGESPAGDLPAEHHGRTMHACLSFGGERPLMASDSMPEGTCGAEAYQGIKGCSIALHPESLAEGERLFAALAEGGQVIMPLEKTFWAERFGMLVDRYGVGWMVNCEHP